MKKYIIYSDGGARGNPGPAAIGAVIKDEANNLVQEISKTIGETTNNQAEYQAILAGLEAVKNLGGEEVDCFLDSELVVKQLRHEYKVKNKDLAPLFVKVHNLSLQFKKISFTHVRREQNKEADCLVNKALDNA
ncbi:MAG: ribonuclease HI family protein [Candidatus Falkowbacteria bacterium]|nr:ribonuclease HI family protein [Candidatus Falkowbacteria bacterium]